MLTQKHAKKGGCCQAKNGLSRGKSIGERGRARLLKGQDEKTFPVTDAALVIGGGVAGIQAALELAAGGHQVYLVEKESSIGGIMAALDKTYPTMDCSI